VLQSVELVGKVARRALDYLTECSQRGEGWEGQVGNELRRSASRLSRGLSGELETVLSGDVEDLGEMEPGEAWREMATMLDPIREQNLDAAEMQGRLWAAAEAEAAAPRPARPV